MLLPLGQNCWVERSTVNGARTTLCGGPCPPERGAGSCGSRRDFKITSVVKSAIEMKGKTSRPSGPTAPGDTSSRGKDTRFDGILRSLDFERGAHPFERGRSLKDS